MKAVEFNNLTKQDFDTMSFTDLRHLVNLQGKQANKRIARIEKNRGKVSQSAVGVVKRSGGRFKASGKTKTQLIKEAKRIQTFNKSKGGTVAGAHEIAKEAMKANGHDPDKKKKKKKPKSLKKIKKDIQKKTKKIEQEKGKEASEKYKRRAMAQYKVIQRKRREAREADKVLKHKPQGEPEEPKPQPEEPEVTMQDIENDIDDFDGFSSEDLFDGAFTTSKEYEKLQSRYNQQQREESDLQSLMPELSGDWSSAFI